VLHASLNTNPYGINPVLQKQQAPAVEKPALLTPVQDSKKPQMPNFKVTPRSSSKMKLRGVAPVNQGPSILEVTQSRLMSPSNLNPSASPRNPVSLGLDSRFTPRKSVKRLTIDEAADLVQPTPGIQKTPKSTLTFDPLLEESAAQLITPARQNGVKSPLSKSPTKSPLKSSPTKSEYVLQPPLKDLLLMSDQDLRHVENFCISLHGVGQVSFLDPVDLLYSSPTGTRAGIKSIAGKIVILENKLCTVYPDEDLKPPPGFGLNVPAEISLHRCWPIDKATREYITDEKDVRHDRHMRKLAEMSDTTFIGFNQMTGTWKFRVEHFSKYGLVDDDEDDGEELPIVPKNVDDLEGFDSAINESSIYIQDSFQQGPIKAKTLSYAAIKDDIPNDKYHLEEEEKEEYEYYQQDVSSEELEIIEEEEEEVDVHEEISEEDIYYEEEETEELDIEDEEEEELVFDGEEEEAEDEDEYVPEPEPLRPSISELALAQKVQAMKQALFPHASPITQPIPSSPMFTVPKRNAEAAGDEQSSRASFSPQPNDAIMNMMPSPTKYRKIVTEPILLDKLVPFEKSVFYDKRNCVDAAIYMGRSFRVGWAGNSFTAVSKTIGKVSIIKVATIVFLLYAG
jgi:nuclear pore complex protein Nup98-Nup96